MDDEKFWVVNTLKTDGVCYNARIYLALGDISQK
jgi:hypothetical protein